MQVPNTIQPAPNMRNNFSTRPSLPSPRLYNFGSSIPTLPGRYVNSEDEITPGEVEMDNSIFYFPARDLSHIFIRQWSPGGQLEHLTYVLEQPNSQEPLPAPPPPSNPQPEQIKNDNVALTEVLTNLNQGLMQTLGQVGQVLQGMQNSIDSMSKQLSALSDGGVG